MSYADKTIEDVGRKATAGAGPYSASRHHGKDVSIRVSDTGGSKRVGVIVATVAVVLSGAMLVVAWQLFDGSAQVASLFSEEPVSSVEPAVANQAEPEEPETLQLPSGMTESFALRLWQEQVDSQRMITKLVEGEVASLVVDGVDQSEDEATLDVHVVMKDGTKLPGELGMRRFGSVWYIAHISGRRGGATAATPDTELPALADVDAKLLSTIMDQPPRSAEVTQELASGRIRSSTVESVSIGPNTATITLRIGDAGSVKRAELVAISQDVDGRDIWFLARFDHPDSADDN